VDEIVNAYNKGEADFHQVVADMADIPRKQAKTINLGLFYGMGKNKLQAELGVSKENAEDLFRTYHDKVPFVKMLMESVMRRAQDKGRVRTFTEVGDVDLIYGSLISLEYIKHCHTKKRSRNTDQGSKEHIHTKL